MADALTAEALTIAIEEESQELDEDLSGGDALVTVYFGKSFHDVISVEPREDGRGIVLNVDPIGRPA